MTFISHEADSCNRLTTRAISMRAASQAKRGSLGKPLDEREAAPLSEVWFLIRVRVAGRNVPLRWVAEDASRMKLGRRRPPYRKQVPKTE
jgi:hypothetical protein